LNEFICEARYSFGARVTNFELDIFLKRLPTLWNSKEGRKAVLRQMQIVNDLNRLHNNSLLEAMKKGGGIRKLDVDQAEEYALTKNKSKINELEKEYRQLDNQVNSISAENEKQRKPLSEIFGEK